MSSAMPCSKAAGPPSARPRPIAMWRKPAPPNWLRWRRSSHRQSAVRRCRVRPHGRRAGFLAQLTLAQLQTHEAVWLHREEPGSTALKHIPRDKAVARQRFTNRIDWLTDMIKDDVDVDPPTERWRLFHDLAANRPACCAQYCVLTRINCCRAQRIVVRRGHRPDQILSLDRHVLSPVQSAISAAPNR